MNVCISVTGSSGKDTFSRFLRRREKITNFLLTDVIKKMEITLPGGSLRAGYPWCFVMPAPGKKDCFYFGALLPVVECSDNNLVFALHTLLSFPALCGELQSHFHIAFWLSRILSGYQRQDRIISNRAALKEWIVCLEHSCSPFWEKLLINEQYRFRSRSALLLSTLAEDEDKINSDSGVGVMQWKGWPDCIQTEKRVWLWRQSRYGRIIDSQNISL
ncbi:hypothetical protein EHW66_18100 [Erwinia psidii]|uniref:hypothetical protein n=1 Tax=Erwinia psidii TaxID=69224 RepID=UPI00226B2EC6|nr:hypothetical protein [Erwinia psidii]MCX8966821.1 hypothetical protein [Erwinia psidii]